MILLLTAGIATIDPCAAGMRFVCSQVWSTTVVGLQCAPGPQPRPGSAGVRIATSCDGLVVRDPSGASGGAPWPRFRYHLWYLCRVAMTLRLVDEEAEALRQRAALEGRSMQDVARQAIREYVEEHSRADLLGRVLDEEVPRYAEALRRLAE
jgi:hypothetical protein